MPFEDVLDELGPAPTGTSETQDTTAPAALAALAAPAGASPISSLPEENYRGFTYQISNDYFTRQYIVPPVDWGSRYGANYDGMWVSGNTSLGGNIMPTVAPPARVTPTPPTTSAQPEPPGVPRIPPDTFRSVTSDFGAFTCSGCSQRIENEPKCEHCNKCVACCSCTLCATCCGLERSPCDSCRSCRNCCHCWTCEACHRRRPPAVQKCEMCGFCVGNCCHCWTCGHCGTRYGRDTGVRSCENCSNCLTCCTCTLIHYLNPAAPRFHLVPAGETDRRTEVSRIGPPPAYRVSNASQRFIATEIEVSGTASRSNRRVAMVLQKWGGAIVSDGSLPSGGFEINTAPAAGDVYIKEIEEICEALKMDGAFADQRAGAHVHVDARDFTFFDIRRLVLLYAKIEPGLYGLCAPHRADNRYCIPCGPSLSARLDKGLSAEDTKKLLLKKIYPNANTEDRSVEQLRIHKYSDTRYNALNLHSWMHRGTIECRIMHGSVDAPKIYNWGVMMANVLDYAYKHAEEEIRAIKKKPIEVLLDIMPTDELRQWISNRWAFFHRERR